ncbi:bifunctional phosphoglucose/phosphomannose isomerase [Candidatus Woesearchaeota archaeon]|nr:bifunctional phosphoglucose/phosphomannose isomerase [Candidatus Woesearchaeota archaeon]
MDKDNHMLKILEGFRSQCEEAYKLSRKIKVKGSFKNAVVCGMGGSGIAGHLIKAFEKKIPIYVHNDYGVPDVVNNKSLVIVISYSGNTEETLSAYSEAKKKKAKIVSITSGGNLAEKDKDALIVPPDLPPRAAMGYLFISALVAMARAKIISDQDTAIREAVKGLVSKTCSREGFMLAKKMNNKIPVFYGSEEMRGVVYRMKCQINENAKQPAFYNVFPEMDHNEINGFKKQGKKMISVFLMNNKDNIAVKKRMDITKRLIKEQTNTAEIQVKGKNHLAKMLRTIYVGDFASYYLSLMNKEDPTPVPLISKLKERLKR